MPQYQSIASIYRLVAFDAFTQRLSPFIFGALFCVFCPIGQQLAVKTRFSSFLESFITVVALFHSYTMCSFFPLLIFANLCALGFFSA